MVFTTFAHPIPLAHLLSASLLAHVWIVDVPQRHKGLLDGLRRGPAQNIMWSSGLVIGAGHPAASEWLLAHHGSSGLVVDVEVSSGHFKLLQSALDEIPGSIRYELKITLCIEVSYSSCPNTAPVKANLVEVCTSFMVSRRSDSLYT